MIRTFFLASVLATSCADSGTSQRGTEDPPGASAPSTPVRDPELRSVRAEDVADLLHGQPGRVLMVNVWATWCEPCVEEFPELIRVAREYRPRGLSVLFLSADPGANHEAALEFLVEHRAPMPGYVKTGTDQPFITALHPRWSGTLPATMLFDADRRPQYLWEQPVDRETLTGPIERMLTRSGSEP